MKNQAGEQVREVDAGRSRRALWVIVLVAMAARITWALLIPVVPESDGEAYDAFARALSQHGVFGWTKDEPFAFWPPGTSMVYAALYWLTGTNYIVIVLLNLMLGAVLVMGTVRVATRFFGSCVGLCAGLVIAMWPTMIMLTTLLVSELLFLVLTLFALDLWTARRGRMIWFVLAAGALLGAATLVRPIAMLLPIVFAGAMWLQSRFDRRVFFAQASYAVVASLAMACVVAPWTVRNYHLYGEFIPVSTNGGVTLWMGNSPASDGYMIDLPPDVLGLNDRQTEVILGARARAYIAADPVGFVLRSAKKLVYLYNNESIGALWNSGGIERRFGSDAVHVFKRFTQITWAAIFVAAVIGVWCAVRQHGLWSVVTSPVVAMGAYFSLIHAVVLTGDRYHLVSAVAIASMAGFAFAALGARAAQGRRDSAVVV